MERRPKVIATSAVLTAAVVGNAFVGRDALGWFGRLRQPRWQLPMPGFFVVAAAYYGVLGRVLARALDRRDFSSVGWAGIVLIGNEAWNLVLFRRRSLSGAFLGMGVYLIPLIALQRSVWSDGPSRRTLLPYTAFVIGYDLPWFYGLWRLNRGLA